MVFIYQSRSPYKWKIWVGEDMYENDELIKWGLPQYVWFHVDDLSSAHVYIELEVGQTINDIPEDVLEDCCQLCKQSSKKGCKEPTVQIVYTPWPNLKKENDMDVGQVSYHKPDKVLKRPCSRNKTILNTIEKTKMEDKVNLKAVREEYDAKERLAEKKRKIAEKKAQKEQIEKKQQQDDILHYKSVLVEDKMHSNKDVKKTVAEIEDDFM